MESKQSVIEKFDNRPDVTVLDRQYLTTRLTQIVNDDFNRIAWFTSILVFVVLLITYGRIELAMVSFIPMLISWIWILGIMGIMGITFNIINIIVSALIFGLGDDYSLFIMDGLLQEYKTGKKNLSSFKSSIFLSAITTIAGLGVLIFAKHPALRSVAFIFGDGHFMRCPHVPGADSVFIFLIDKKQDQAKLFSMDIVELVQVYVLVPLFCNRQHPVNTHWSIAYKAESI
ncbi:MAG: MMPL family transporter [Bacteroidota bacterium]